MSSENVKSVEQVEREMLEAWESIKSALMAAEHEFFKFTRGVASAGVTTRKSARAMKTALTKLTSLTLECDKARKAAKALNKPAETA
jgi:hypothetical protein